MSRSILALGWRAALRDLAAGELTTLLLAVALAVAAVATVGFVTARAERALALEANRLLGGDAVVRGDQPIPAAVGERALALGLKVTETQGFPSMLRHGETLKLSEVRALGAGFPLRGSYRLTGADGEEFVADGVPARGTVWLSRGGALAFDAKVGSAVVLGQRSFTVAALVAQEPDSALDYFNVAPRVFLNLDDLGSTGLVQEGSRVGYRVIVAGPAPAVQQFVDATRQELSRGQRIETIADARPEIRSALARAGRFLGLAALVAVVLAAIAVAMAARRHVRHHLDACALLRCLGATQSEISRIYLVELAVLTVASCAAGLAFAYVLDFGIAQWLGAKLGLDLPAPGARPALEAVLTGSLVLFGFAAPPILALRRVPPLRVLRRDLELAAPAAWSTAVLGIGALGTLIAARAESVTLATAMLVGLGLTLVALGLVGFALVAVVKRLRGGVRGAGRLGLANLGRRPLASVTQIAALGLGLTVLLVLTLVRTELLERWRSSRPPDAPDRFVINAQADQVDALGRFMTDAGVAAPTLYPMIRGRLVAVNDRPVDPQRFGDERAQRLAEREFNLSMAAALKPDNTVVAGTFWPPAGPAQPELSVEEGIANALGWKLGDTLAFDIAGRRYEAAITSLRHVDWESFNPNFFVLGSPGSFDGYAASYITSFRMPPDRPRFVNELIAAFPNLSVIDVGAVIERVESTIGQVATVVEFVFGFTLAAGVLVLVAALGASQDERLREGAVMRALGARRRQLRLAQTAEFVALGGVAGLTAALAATALSGTLATRVFELDWTPGLGLPVAGAALGIVVVTACGLLLTRGVVAQPPAASLRALLD